MEERPKERKRERGTKSRTDRQTDRQTGRHADKLASCRAAAVSVASHRTAFNPLESEITARRDRNGQWLRSCRIIPSRVIIVRECERASERTICGRANAPLVVSRDEFWKSERARMRGRTLIYHSNHERCDKLKPSSLFSRPPPPPPLTPPPRSPAIWFIPRGNATNGGRARTDRGASSKNKLDRRL